MKRTFNYSDLEILKLAKNYLFGKISYNQKKDNYFNLEELQKEIQLNNSEINLLKIMTLYNHNEPRVASVFDIDPFNEIEEKYGYDENANFNFHENKLYYIPDLKQQLMKELIDSSKYTTEEIQNKNKKISIVYQVIKNELNDTYIYKNKFKDVIQDFFDDLNKNLEINKKNIEYLKSKISLMNQSENIIKDKYMYQLINEKLDKIQYAKDTQIKHKD